MLGRVLMCPGLPLRPYAPRGATPSTWPRPYGLAEHRRRARHHPDPAHLLYYLLTALQTVRNFTASLGLGILGPVLVSQLRSRVLMSLLSQGTAKSLA
jgi:hypothetical protein